MSAFTKRTISKLAHQYENMKQDYLERLEESVSDVDAQIKVAKERLHEFQAAPHVRDSGKDQDARRKQQEVDDTMRTLETLKNTIDRKDK